MKRPNILLGDQLEAAIRLCTQSIGVWFGFKGKRLDDNAVARCSLFELNVLTTPFLYYLSRSGLGISKQTVDILIDTFMMYRSASGSFDSTKLTSFKTKGNVIDTALGVINLIKIDQLGLTCHQKDILEATEWLTQNTNIINSKNEIHFDSLLSCYTLLLTASLLEDKNIVKTVVQKLQPLRFITEINSITTSNENINPEIVFPFGIRILIDIANLTGHEHFYALTDDAVTKSASTYQSLFEFLREGKTTLFNSKKIDLGALSLWSYTYLQLYAHTQTPELLELATLFLRLVSDVIIDSEIQHRYAIPTFFNIRKGEHGNNYSISYLRYFLDAAELAKEHIATSISLGRIETEKPLKLNNLRYEV